MSGKQTSLVELQEATLHALSIVRDEAVHLFENPQLPPSRPDYTLRLLFRYLMDRCQTVSFLVSHRYAWDAEIVLRSFYETAAKFLFIAYPPAAEAESSIGREEPQIEVVKDRHDYARRYEARYLTEDGTPLSDEEQRALALRAIELSVINPLRMLRRASRAITQISQRANGETSEARPELLIQVGPDRLPLNQINDESAEAAEQLWRELAVLVDWLAESAKKSA